MPGLEKINSMLYALDDEDRGIEVILEGDTVWLNMDQMAELFEKSRSTINEHIINIYKDDELEKEGTLRKIGNTDISLKSINYYNLDVIIAVGYRVNSKKATKFRVWATSILKQYLKDGYVINEVLLRENPEKLNQLAVKIRELRANEKNIYASVRKTR